MQKIVYLFCLLFVFAACKDNNHDNKTSEIRNVEKESITIQYAKGFEVKAFEGYKSITLKSPWPGTEKTFKYALVEKGAALPNRKSFDAVVEIPLERIVVTSTTHIPSLEMLGENEALVGFPNLDYISSEKTRQKNCRRENNRTRSRMKI